MFPSVNFVQPRPTSESSSTLKNNLTLMKTPQAREELVKLQLILRVNSIVRPRETPVLADVKEIILRLVASAVD